MYGTAREKEQTTTTNLHPMSSGTRNCRWEHPVALAGDVPAAGHRTCVQRTGTVLSQRKERGVVPKGR